MASYYYQMQFHDLYIVITGFISEYLGTISGFGSSTFFVPVGLFFEKYQFILALTSVLHVFGNISKIYLFRNDLNRDLIIKYALSTALLTGVGALLNQYVAFNILKTYLGIFIIILSVFFFFKNTLIQKLSHHYAIPIMSLSGFLTGFLGTGGVLRGIAMTTLAVPKNTFVALSSSIDLGGDLLRGAVYFYNGYFDWSHWYYIPLILVASVAGSFLGKKTLNKLNQSQFEKIVAVFILISGLALVFEAPTH